MADKYEAAGDTDYQADHGASEHLPFGEPSPDHRAAGRQDLPVGAAPMVVAVVQEISRRVETHDARQRQRKRPPLNGIAQVPRQAQPQDDSDDGSRVRERPDRRRPDRER